MKKIIALFMAALTAALILTSCGTTPTPAPTPSEKTQSAAETETGTPTIQAPSADTPEPSVETPPPDTETPEPSVETPTPETPTPTVTPTPLPADPAEVLKGKTALFCGDSIVMASTHDKEHQWWGWAGRIKEYYGLKTQKNAGVDGASVSNCRGSNLIINQVQNNKNGKYDFVILEGGTNDAWDIVTVGRMVPKPASETKPSDLDRSTFCGGLEAMLYFAKTGYPGATIGYIITTQMNSTTGTVSEMSRYVEATKAICVKWGVPCLDLYNDKAFIKEYDPVKSNTNTPDGIHPNSAGYEIYTRYIAQFMADIYGKTYEEVYEQVPYACDVKGVLEGKTVLFYGDSIGAITSHDEKQQSYAGRIAELYGANSINKCVAGASLSTVRGENTVVKQTRADRRREADIIVLEGGVNDAWDNAPIGALCDEVTPDHYDEDKLDLTTLAGGLEQLLYEIKRYHPDALTVFIINYRLNSSAGSLKNMTKHVKLIKAACEKWGVPYLDFYNDGYIKTKFNVLKSKTYIADGIHPSTEGYDVLAPLIAEFIADEYVKTDKFSA